MSLQSVVVFEGALGLLGGALMRATTSDGCVSRISEVAVKAFRAERRGRVGIDARSIGLTIRQARSSQPIYPTRIQYRQSSYSAG